MCGFCGFVGPPPRDAEGTVAAMNRTLAHRGPDDEGTHVERFAGRGGEQVLALGHRRLAILDLSPLGHQPMHTPDGALSIAYNGEVYNYRELREELVGLGHAF